MLDKKPTVSLPSAREVLRTKVGDCNEHTALYVAMARSLGLPARVAVGLVYAHGAFYYHAWPEVYIVDAGAAARGLWLPVDPTLNQFPADATHMRLARGGLDKQTVILPLIGQPQDDDPPPRSRAELDADPGRAWRERSVVGAVPFPVRAGMTCWFSPGAAARCVTSTAEMITIENLVKKYGTFTAVDGVSLDVAIRARSTASSARTAPARRRRFG